jgi:hypothetical protein
MEDITYAYLILLDDEREPSGVFLTEEEAHAAAERYLAAHWSKEENRIKTADYLSGDEKESALQILEEEKDFWKEEGFIDDLIYIERIPFGKLVSYWGDKF